jgi:hypothetical protein
MNGEVMKACLLLLALLPVIAQAAPFAGEMYQQTLRLRFASPAEAKQARIRIAPVYDDREWALSARWDDCNANSLIMREHMAKFGIKGTFYLTGTDPKGQFGEQFARELQRDGCSIGGHSMTHPDLTTLSPNAIWHEIVANRVEREAQTDTLINSFAFPYGQFRSAKNPQAQQDITEALDRAGYFHCVYQEFLKDNPFLKPEEWSTGWQVVPGDKVVEPDQFQASLDRVLRAKEANQVLSHCIFLGVHAWQQGDEWAKFDAVLATLNNRSWWMCNQTEWAAYARQVRETELHVSEAGPKDRIVECVLGRPLAAELGAAVPLTLAVEGAVPQAAQCDEGSVTLEQRGDTAVLNLPPRKEWPLPAKIDQVAVTPNAAEAVTPAKFPFLHLKVHLRLQDPRPTLGLTWEPAPDLTGASVSFRLPPRYRHSGFSGGPTDGPVLRDRGMACPLEERPNVERYRTGPETFVIELNFATRSGVGRAYVTFQTDVDTL